MALTKVLRGGLSTGVSDSSDATALEITSSEDIVIKHNTNNAKLVFNDQSNSSNFFIQQIGSSGSPALRFFESTGDERMRIHNGGVLSVNQGIALGVGSNNTASNVLDDYEEGTWTPAVNVGTISTSNYPNSNYYVKVGNLVVAYCRFNAFSDTSSGTGFIITGLPFAIKSTSGLDGHVGDAWGNEMGDHRSFFLYGQNTATQVSAYYGAAGNASYNTVTYSNFGSNTNVICKIVYHS